MRTHVPSTSTLPDGLRVRLRLPHGADRPALAGLLRRLGLTAGDLEIVRVLRFDPRRRAAICATAWLGGVEELVAFGCIAAADGARPEVLLADEVTAPGVGALLAQALEDWADRRTRGAA